MTTPVFTFQNPIPRMLADARDHLLWCRASLSLCRKMLADGPYTMPGEDDRVSRSLFRAERDFLDALDRVWDVQSMTIASF